jgi:hypothetical protein
MRVTIIPSDGFVSVNGDGVLGLDLSFMDAGIHAIQWYDTEGEIEWKGEQDRVVENEKITDLDPYQPALTLWQEAKNSVEG